MAFPITGRRHVVDRLERCAAGPEQRIDLGIRPDVEAPLLAFAVGVDAGGEAGAAVVGGAGAHLPQQPTGGLADARLEQRVALVLPDRRQQIEHLRIVVEHLLEVRHEPALVDGIAGETAAEMVPDAALAHLRQRRKDGAAERL